MWSQSPWQSVAGRPVTFADGLRTGDLPRRSVVYAHIVRAGRFSMFRVRRGNAVQRAGEDLSTESVAALDTKR